jgi:hypothetical protein
MLSDTRLSGDAEYSLFFVWPRRVRRASKANGRLPVGPNLSPPSHKQPDFSRDPDFTSGERVILNEDKVERSEIPISHRGISLVKH